MDKKLPPFLEDVGFLKKDLDRLELALEEFTNGLEGILQKTVKNTLNAGGKRLRPLLFFICAANERYNIDYLMPAALSIEMMHTASLIHDDIIDKAIFRRGRETVYYKYGKDTAKFVGDFLFTHTFSLLNSYHEPVIMKEMSDAAKMLVKGEFDQLKTKNNFLQNEDVYFEKIREKTSALFALSCALGGVLSNSDKEDIENMKKFGEYIGISFQINDDLIDVDTDTFSGSGLSSKKSGKPAGNDLRQGNITLPFIYALENAAFKKEVMPLMLKKYLSDSDIKKIFKIILKTDAILKTKEKSRQYLLQARETAKLINGQVRKKGLLGVCDYIMSESGQKK
ncbi:MAG: polyprenyl synthetase family protein [Actinobacteria bacterium]|nr:polyprenyl synthetase family protein [Actinomycetota bacterium]